MNNYNRNQQKLVVTKEEYDQIQNFINVINDKTLSSPRRKIAKARYESMLRFIKNRPVNRKLSKATLNKSIV